MSIPVINTEGTAKRIKEHIQKAGRRNVAEACGVSMQAVFYWENGHNLPQLLEVMKFKQEDKRNE